VVALKRLHRQLVRSGDALARLRRELEALRQIRHPAIVGVRDLVRWEGDPTIVMDFIDGEDLKARILRLGTLPTHEIERIARALLDALATTHASGIVHRDVKPQNVRIDHDGGVHLLDFGSARLDASSQLTATGTTVGTPEYMAPELFAASTYDPRADLYGVGATLFECLIGRVPQTADSLAELAHLRLHEDIAPVASLRNDAPLALSQLVDRCLARAPEDRPASARLALFALEHPEAERAFAARKSNRPLCLHCKAAIARESRVCSACGSDHPFCYAPGRASVVIRSVRDPKAFLDYAATLFPEQASATQLLAMSERLSALGYGGQRWVGWIAWDEARRIVDELKVVGVHAEVVDVDAPNGTILLVAVLTFLLSVSIRALQPLWWFALQLFAIAIAARLWASTQTMLSSHTAPRPISMRMHVALGVIVVTAGSLLVESVLLWPRSLFARPWWEITSQQVLATSAVCACVAFAVSTWARFRENRTSRAQSPQPSMVAGLFAPRTGLEDHPATYAPPPTPVATGLLLVVAIPLMFAVEVVGLVVLATKRPREVVAPAQLAVRHLAPTSLPTQAPVPPSVSGRPASRVVEPPIEEPFDPRPFLPAVAIALTIPWIAMRRRRVRADAATIFAELDLRHFADLSARDAPIARQRDVRADAATRLARVRRSVAHDAFWADAVRRASELILVLPPEAGTRLCASLEELRSKKSMGTADRSLAARCILEADPEQKARFDFLALEGELEAEAARAWEADAARRR
jgi:hypothetical protein